MKKNNAKSTGSRPARNVYANNSINPVRAPFPADGEPQARKKSGDDLRK